ncbi:MAG: His/Gly/Thr/Pro-type tRNA ligase C-terminal domain-containing protein [Mollicutes bacterium UO1]
MPCQIAILPINDEKEVTNYCEYLEKELVKNNLRVKIFSEKSLNYRIRQVYQKKTPYYLVIGEQETQEKILKLIDVYQQGKVEELSEKSLYNKLKYNIQ